nr:hypothetical protein [Tanacetum cinerariifolium]
LVESEEDPASPQEIPRENLQEMMLNRVTFPWLLPSPCMIKVLFPQGMRTIFSAHAMTAWYFANQSISIIVSKLPSSTGIRFMLNGWFEEI